MHLWPSWLAWNLERVLGLVNAGGFEWLRLALFVHCPNAESITVILNQALSKKYTFHFDRIDI